MKSIAVVVTLVILVVFGLGAFGAVYNKQLWDFTFSFERAVIAMPDGHIIEGKVDSWKDFNDADQIQVKMGGKTYLTHISNVVLISE